MPKSKISKAAASCGSADAEASARDEFQIRLGVVEPSPAIMAKPDQTVRTVWIDDDRRPVPELDATAPPAFDRPYWNGYEALSWICYRDPKRLGDVDAEMLFVLKTYTKSRPERDPDCAKTLTRALLGGEIKAIKNGESMLPAHWVGKVMHRTDWSNYYFWRNDVLKKWSVPTLQMSEDAENQAWDGTQQTVYPEERQADLKESAKEHIIKCLAADKFPIFDSSKEQKIQGFNQLHPEAPRAVKRRAFVGVMGDWNIDLQKGKAGKAAVVKAIEGLPKEAKEKLERRMKQQSALSSPPISLAADLSA
jgi:hypothetical protein